MLPRSQKLSSGDATYALALSSDGRRLAYVGEQEGGTQLWVRELSSLESKPLAGTVGATHPFFSPDGEWIGYFAGGALQKVAASGGAPLRICTVTARSLGASWGRDERIVFALWGSGLHVVEARGGEPRRIGSLEDARWPEILPDGRTVLFTTQRAFATMSIDGSAFRVAATTTDSPLHGPAVLGTGTLAQARYLPTGHIVFGQAPGIVRAAPFDPASARLTGPVASVVQSVERARNAGAVYFAVASTGVLVYATTGYRHRLVWVDRSGAASPISADRAAFRSPRLSPDGAQLAVAVNDETRRGRRLGLRPADWNEAPAHARTPQRLAGVDARRTAHHVHHRGRDRRGAARRQRGATHAPGSPGRQPALPDGVVARWARAAVRRGRGDGHATFRC